MPDAEQSAPTPVDHVVITVHGIRTFGLWQERLESIVGPQPGLQMFHYRFGYFSVFAFLVPPIRWLVTRRFQSQLETIVNRYQGAKIDLVGHSFGTHLIAWALLHVSKKRTIRIRNIILAASVLRSSFPWEKLIGNGTVATLVNECGSQDSVLLLSQFFVLFTGMAGRLGFVGMTNAHFVSNWYPFGHSGFFVKNGHPDDTFMYERWRPILVESRVPSPQPRPGGSLSGFAAFLLQNAEPIKIMIYALVFILPLIYVSHLYVSQKTLTHISESRQLAYKAEEEIWSDPVRSGKDASDAYKAYHTGEAASALANATVQSNALAVFSDVRHVGPISGVAFDRDERLAIASTYWDEVWFWDLSSRTFIRAVPSAGDFRVANDSESPDKQFLAVGAPSSKLVLYDMQTGAPRAQFAASTIGTITSTSFSPDGHFIATSSNDGTVEIWDIKKILSGTPDPASSLLPATPVAARNFKSKIVNSVHFSDDGQYVITANQGGLGVIWAWNSKRFALLDRFCSALPAAEFAPHDHTKAITAGQDGIVTLYATSTQGSPWVETHPVWSVGLHALDVSQASFNPAGDAIVTSSHDGKAAVWSATDGHLLYSLPGHRGAVTDAAFSPDSKLILTSSTDGTVRLWKAAPTPPLTTAEAQAAYLGSR